MRFEGLGIVAAEKVAATDFKLQQTRERIAPFGGILILGAGDPKQLLPPQCLLVCTSPINLTSVRMFSLKKCVTMTVFVGGQFLGMLSVPKSSESDIEQNLETSDENCLFCDFDSSPVDGLRIFGTRAAEWKAVNAKLKEYQYMAQCVRKNQV